MAVAEQKDAAENPLLAGLPVRRRPDPCTVVIFGASGDLTKRKLVPALYSLAAERLLPPSFAIVGYARKPVTDDAFRADMREWCNSSARHRPVDEALWGQFSKGLYFQTLMVSRFANSLFEPLWNNRYVEQVQITGAEALGIEGRGGYFDHAGILRDMVQNHLFQVLSLTSMEPPVSMSGNDLRDEKVK